MSLPAGTDKTLTLMVLEAPFGYDVEVRDRSGVLSRRHRPRRAWIAVPLVVLVATGGCLLATRGRTDSAAAVVEVQTMGAGGTKLTTTYSGILGLDPSDAVSLGSAGAASSVFTGRPLFRPIWYDYDPLFVVGQPLNGSEWPVGRGLGGGMVEAGVDGGQTLRLSTVPWQLRTVQTISVGGGDPVIEAKLRLVGGSKTSPHRVTGTVTNRGQTTILSLRAQIIEGQARLTDRLEPGATIEVDTPIITTRNGSGENLLPATPDEAAMFAAASRSFSAPGQVAVVGISPAQPAPAVGSGRRTTLGGSTVVVGVVPLEAAGTVLAGTGGARRVSLGPGLDGAGVLVVDLAVLPGTPPLSLRYPARLTTPGRPEPLQFFDVFDWRTATWRTLPPTGRTRYAYTDAPLGEGEVDAGLVRVRQRGFAPLEIAIGGVQLLLTSDSEAEAARQP